MNSVQPNSHQVPPSTFSVSLTQETHTLAQQFYQHHAMSKKAKQVYLNTLAVWAVNYYLKCLGIESDLEASDSWNPLLQTLADVADLVIKGKGKLECRPVLPNSDICQIPGEVWSDRLGYVAVQLNPSLTEATLLGFIREVAVEKVPLSYFQPLEQLIACLSEPTAPPLVTLSQWLQNRFEEGWVAVETLLAPQQLEPAFRYRTVKGTGESQPRKSSDWIERGRPIHLETVDREVTLCVALKPTDNSDLNVWVDLYPQQEEPYLPPNLELAVLDEEEREAMQAKTKDDSQCLQFNFIAHPGDLFSIRITLEGASITQPFVI